MSARPGKLTGRREAGSTAFTSPGAGEDILATVRGAVAQGFDTVVAAGGDGTVSAVANGLIGSGARLGIIPLGTANVLAPSWESHLRWRTPASC